MAERSGIEATARSLPTGGGAVTSTGDGFQPNLAMGGGSYRLPIELPSGPGGFAPKLELAYDTGFGNSAFGLGWTLATPFIERRAGTGAVEEFLANGAERLEPLSDGSFAPAIQSVRQVYSRVGDHWASRGVDLVEARFGASTTSRVEGTVAGETRVHQWMLDRITFPGDRVIEFEWEVDDSQRYLSEVRWSVFRLSLHYEDRSDPFSSYRPGFELATTRRCHRLELHHEGLAPQTLIRTLDLEYDQAPHVGTSLLRAARLTGIRHVDGKAQITALPAQKFSYTEFDPPRAEIGTFDASTAAPPPLGGDVTLVDRSGTALPGVLKMNGNGAYYWENRGGLRWGPPEELRALPQGVALGADRLRFADLDGTTTADLVIDGRDTVGYHPNDPDSGFLPKRNFRLAPSFAISDPDTWLLDLDGDRVADMLTFRNGVPIGFLNEDRGLSWSTPKVLPRESLPDLEVNRDRIRFADMTGDGQPDCVLLRSRQVTYWPNLGDGRFGEPQTMASTPEFDVADSSRDAILADVDGDGTADLILLGTSVVTIHLNSGGRSYGDPITIERTPTLAAGRTLVADMAGTGTVGLLWNSPAEATYHYLDLAGGVKPYLLAGVDNGQGMNTTIEYGTSVQDAVVDRDNGEPSTGYLPFAVHVVRRMTQHDTVLGLVQATDYAYHDGNYDRTRREYLGFGRVEASVQESDHAAATRTRYHFHNRAPGGSSTFEAGRGHPRRTELIDPATGEVRKVDEAVWEARAVAGSAAEAPAYLTVEVSRTSSRIEAGSTYHREQIDYDYDAAGNRNLEHRRGEWTDSTGVARTDELIIEHDFAQHPVHGITSFESQLRKRDSAGRLLQRISMHYDGAAFTGLGLGSVEHGFKTRQTTLVLTGAEVAEAYGGTAPDLLDDLYEADLDPALGKVWLKDDQRYRVDGFGNQLATIDARGHRIDLTYGPDSIHPRTISEDGGPPRPLQFDPISGQVTRAEDLDGNVLEYEYDALGNVLEVRRRTSSPGRPTETYEYRRDVLPHSVVKRIRIDPDDAEPGFVQFQYLDGSGRVAQAKTLAEDASWATQEQSLLAFDGQAISRRDAYFSPTSDYDESPVAGVAERRFRCDFASRLVREEHFSGATTLYVHEGATTRIYGPDASAAFLADPSTPPTRTQMHDAWDRVVSVWDHDDTHSYEQVRAYDPLGRLTEVVDCLGHTVVRHRFDFCDNCIRLDSADAGTTTFVYEAGDEEVLRTDADGRTVFRAHDLRGRTTEVREGGVTGTVLESFTYDTGAGTNLAGKLARVVGGFGTVDYSYEAEGNPVSIRRTFTGDPRTFEVGFEYNGAGSVTGVVYPDGSRTDYEYHPNGMLAAVPEVIDEIEYAASGRRRRVAFANGLETIRTVTAGDEFLTEILTRPIGGGPKFQHLVHTYDEMGQVQSIEDHSSVAGKVRNDQTFEYDQLHRLVRATGRDAGGGYDFEYRYDELGNLTLSEEGVGEEILYGHQLGRPQPNHLVRRASATSDEYVYDASGNLTFDPEVGQMHYDARHRLVRVERTDGSVVAITYDHNGRRCATSVTAGGSTSIRLEVERVYLVDSHGATRVVIDQRERLAVIPESGDALLYHPDRLGNVNVVSNLTSGAFVGHHEYGPYGTLGITITLQPNFTFQGARFDEGLDIVLLGARHYRPALGRFLAPDPYLLMQPTKLPGFQIGCNLYAYALANPANTTDKTGQLAFLAVLVIAMVVGAVVGAIGAAATGASTWDEWLLFIVGGAIGGALVALTAGGLGLWLAGSAAAATWAGWAVAVWAAVSILGSLITPALDESESGAAWVLSFAIKWIQSPITTTVGVIAALIVWAGGGDVDFERGMLFVSVGGSAYGAMTLGGVAWTLGGGFEADGSVKAELAEHEAVHSRQVVALGELGFYVTYITLGGIFGVAQGGPWIGLNESGCGNPFEKTPWPIDHPGVTPKPAHESC